MAFEKYDYYQDKKIKAPTVTISNNYLVLNKVAREKLKCNCLELAFERESNKIRIRPSEDGEIISKTKIYAKGFFKQFGIYQKGKFRATYNQSENALYIDLNENL